MNSSVTFAKPFQAFESLCHSVAESAKTNFTRASNSFRSLLVNVCHIKEDSSTFTHLWKLIPATLVATAGEGGWGAALASPAGRAVGFAEGVALAGDVGDFFSGKMLKGGWMDIAGRIAFAFSNLGTTMVWAKELGFFTGSVGLFSSFGVMASGGAVVGFGLGATGAFARLVSLKDYKITKEITVKSLLDLVACTSGAALVAVSLFGATIAPVTAALLVIASSGCGLMSFCYARKHAKVLEEYESFEAPGQKETKGFWNDLSTFIAHSEGTEKAAKLFNKLVEGTSSLPLAALSSEAKCFVDCHELLGLPVRIKEWVYDRFWKEDTTSWWKIANKAFLTGLSVVIATTFAYKYKLLDLGFLAATTIGGIPFFSIAAPAMVVSFSVCGFIDNAINMSKQTDEGNEQRKDDLKAVKEKRELTAAEKAEKLRIKKSKVMAEKKLQVWSEMAENLDKADVQKAVEKNMLHRASKLKVDIKEGVQKKELQKFMDAKITRLTVRYNNAVIRCNKAGVAMLNDSTKAGAAGFGILSAATAAVATAQSLSVVAGGFGLSAAFVGVYKFISEKKFREVREPVPALA